MSACEPLRPRTYFRRAVPRPGDALELKPLSSAWLVCERCDDYTEHYHHKTRYTMDAKWRQRDGRERVYACACGEVRRFGWEDLPS